MNNCPEAVLQERAFDFSIAGQGEIPAIALWNGLAAGAVASDIAGLGYHQAPAPYRNSKAEFGLEGLPPTAYDLFDLRKYRRAFKKMAAASENGDICASRSNAAASEIFPGLSSARTRRGMGGDCGIERLLRRARASRCCATRGPRHP